MPVYANDAWRAALNDFHADATGQTHFAKPLHKIGAPDNLGNFAG
jgi:hypothetical protein